jgi:hypothetical protein
VLQEQVVSQCKSETLFDDLLQGEGRVKALTHSKPMESDLIKFVDNFSKVYGLQMTMRQYFKWLQGVQQFAREKPVNRKEWSKEEKKKRAKKLDDSLFMSEKYKKVFELAKEEWLLSTDGVVKALRYKTKEKLFVAKVVYEKGGKLTEECMTVSDDWVIDTYGKELTKKLMDRAEIIRVRYIPPKFLHKKNKRGEDHATNEIYAKAIWKGMLEDGTVMQLQEEQVTGNFGSRFVDECKRLGNNKFVGIPVLGSCRSSVMMLFPKLRCEEAPPVKFMQGQLDTCVFSSMASAFHYTAIPDLLRVAQVLQDKSDRLSGGVNCLDMAKEIVAHHVKWLQPKRITSTFNWENDMSDNMFVVGVILDSTNSCQHAVTIFRKWIYDSNEPFALPLSQESLDYCTWDIKDGVIHEDSSFVRFIGGWIFKEHEMKKKKILDMVFAPSTMNVNQA